MLKRLICVEVLKTKYASVLISTIFRPPSSKVDILEKIEFENLIQNLDDESKEIILAVGDSVIFLPKCAL